MELNKEKIEQAVVQSVADALIADSDLESRIRSAVDARIDKHFKSGADKRIEEAVNRAITDGLEHEYCRVNSFGQREGQPTTVRKELEQMIAGYWNALVEKSGKPTDSTYSSMRRAEWMMSQLVAADFQGEMRQHIVNLGGSFKDHLRAQLKSTLDGILSEIFHVQSEGDRELGKPGRSCIDPEQKGKL
jgi:hypothetical protein